MPEGKGEGRGATSKGGKGTWEGLLNLDSIAKRLRRKRWRLGDIASDITSGFAMKGLGFVS